MTLEIARQELPGRREVFSPRLGPHGLERGRGGAQAPEDKRSQTRGKDQGDQDGEDPVANSSRSWRHGIDFQRKRPVCQEANPPGPCAIRRKTPCSRF